MDLRFLVGAFYFALITVVTAAYAQEDSDAAVSACEGMIEQVIPSPSTYKRVTYAFDRSPGRGSYVEIGFDAQNVYGAMIRQQARCYFQKSADRFVLTGVEIGPQFQGISNSSVSIPLAETSMK